jgi:hypothetical protein
MDLIVSTSSLLFTELTSQYICIHVTMPNSEMRRTTTSLSTPFWEFQMLSIPRTCFSCSAYGALSTPFWEFPILITTSQDTAVKLGKMLSTPFWEFLVSFPLFFLLLHPQLLSTPFWEFLVRDRR